MSDDDDVEVVNNEAERRWEARLGEVVVGFAEYRSTPKRISFTHTLVEPAYEGRGIGTRLMRAALDDAVQRSQRITPYCPFFRAYLARHDEYAAHVDLPPAR